MTIDYDRLKNYSIPDTHHTYTLRDTLFYALSIGMGADPLDERELDYVYERKLRAMPSLATILATPSGWMRDPATGISPVGTLAVEQSVEIHAPIPSAASLTGRSQVAAIVDRGPDRGALIYVERQVTDDADGRLIFTGRSCTFSRKDGGFGGPSGVATRRLDTPDRAPDHICDLSTPLNAPLLFRLHMRLDPGHPDQHADPALARKLGLPRPSLHGLCTLGVACHGLLRTVCDYDESMLKTLSARFSAPAFPGETLRVEIWRDDGALQFQCRALERDALVLKGGHARLA